MMRSSPRAEREAKRWRVAEVEHFGCRFPEGRNCSRLSLTFPRSPLQLFGVPNLVGLPFWRRTGTRAMQVRG